MRREHSRGDRPCVSGFSRADGTPDDLYRFRVGQLCAAADLLVKIVNNGFVTARLEAELVNTVPVGVTLELDPQPLKGVPEEVRHLRITLTKSGPTDLTVAFRAHHEIPDLGGRDRIHFLMSCLPPR